VRCCQVLRAGVHSSAIGARQASDENYRPTRTEQTSTDEAFDADCTALHGTGQPGIVLEIIAQRIIETAKCRERDPVRFVEAALLGLPANKPSSCRERRLIGEIGNLGYRRPIRDIGRLTMMQARTLEAAFCRASLEGQAAFRGRALSGARLA
jgi:hypothetical protein